MKKELLLLLNVTAAFNISSKMHFMNTSKYRVKVELDYPYEESRTCPDKEIVLEPNVETNYAMPESPNANAKCKMVQIIFTQLTAKDRTNLCVSIHGDHASRDFTIDDKAVSFMKEGKKMSFPFSTNPCAKK